jgi:hypothetical protein
MALETLPGLQIAAEDEGKHKLPNKKGAQSEKKITPDFLVVF